MYLRLSTLLALALANSALAQPPNDRGERPRRPSDAVLAAIDSNGDHEITMDEMKNAFASLIKLDADKDGKLSRAEIHPDIASGGPGGPGGRLNEQPNAEGRGPRGRGGFDGQQRGDGERGGPGRGQGGPGRGGPDGGPPSPEQMIQDAFEFDANKDGLMSKAEMQKFAESHAQRGGPDGGRRGGPGGRDGGDRPSRPARPE